MRLPAFVLRRGEEAAQPLGHHRLPLETQPVCACGIGLGLGSGLGIGIRLGLGIASSRVRVRSHSLPAASFSIARERGHTQ